MTPSISRSATELVSQSDPKLRLLASGSGEYKELGSALDYIRDQEIHGGDGIEAAKYPHYLRTLDPSQRFPPLEVFDHYEHGKDADPSLSNLLPVGTRVADLTPTIGSEVEGIQLSSMNDAGKDELARFVAERKVVAFRNQDFADLSIERALEFGGYFGRHHVHPTSGSPKDFPEVHIVHRVAGDKTAEKFFETRTSSVSWHSDVTYEEQPPVITFLYVLDNPETGGDTLFANTAEAYNRLSPAFQERLHGLYAVHSGVEQVNSSAKRGGIKRREPVVNVRPIVRTHPVTGEKSIYITPSFTREIVGLKKEETELILNFLYNHVAMGADFQARVKWQQRTVVVWDNRNSQHTAILDWKNGQRRHLARITPQAERPYQTPFIP